MRVLLKAGTIFLIAVVCLILYPAVAGMVDAAVNEMLWKDVSSGIRDSDLQMVAVSPDSAETVYTCSSTAVYKTIDSGKYWEEVLSFRGTGNSVNSIAIDPMNAEIIYAGTLNGLYKSKDAGTSWKMIFSGIGELKDSILSIAINPLNPDTIIIGTETGTFRTDTGGNDWKKGENLPFGAAVSLILTDPSMPHHVYAATDRGIYKSTDSGKQWKSIFGAYSLNNNHIEENSASTEAESDEDAEAEAKIKGIAIDSTGAGTLYAFTSEGPAITEDNGSTWKTLSSSGLISRDVRQIITSPSEPGSVYAATGRGVFKYSKASGSWAELYRGLTAIDIRFIATAPKFKNMPSALWAATKKGIFKTILTVHETVPPKTGGKTGDTLSIFDNEPSIKEIQQVAIRYAEVHPEKINGWRKAASRRA